MKFSDDNAIENSHFIFIFNLIYENLLLKIEPSEIPPFFYNNPFGFGGIPPSTLATILDTIVSDVQNKMDNDCVQYKNVLVLSCGKKKMNQSFLVNVYRLN